MPSESDIDLDNHPLIKGLTQADVDAMERDDRVPLGMLWGGYDHGKGRTVYHSAHPETLALVKKLVYLRGKERAEAGV